MSFVYNKGLHVRRHSRNILLIKFYARILIPDLYNSLNQNNVFHTNNFQYIVLRIIPKRLNRIHVWAIPWSINNLQILRSNKVFNCLRTLATYTVLHEYASMLRYTSPIWDKGDFVALMLFIFLWITWRFPFPYVKMILYT